jgi:protein-disulfide isomerase
LAGGRSGKARQQLRRQADRERRATQRTFLGSLAVTGVLFGTLLVAGALAGGEPGPSGNVNGLAPASRPHLGSGPVTVVEFADFQCPACAVVAPMLTQLAEEGGVTLVARHFPLETFHANANGSARAAEAAMQQDAYWAMSEALYANQAAWSNLGSTDADAFFAGLAGQIGLDVDRWMADYASAAVADGVDGDLQVALDMGLPQTPTIFIDGEVYDGALSLEELRAAVAAATTTGG